MWKERFWPRKSRKRAFRSEVSSQPNEYSGNGTRRPETGVVAIPATQTVQIEARRRRRREERSLADRWCRRRLVGLETCGRTQRYEHFLHPVELEMWLGDAARLGARRRRIGGMPSCVFKAL